MTWFWRALAGSYDLLVAPAFGAPGFKARERTWSEPACPSDLGGRHIVVSGANSGIGLAATQMLSAAGATVHMLCRSEERGVRARDVVAERTGAQPVVHVVDMADLASVAGFCRDYSASANPLHGLVHNAGALVHERRLTPQSLESTFACHVVGPFLCNRLLVPRAVESGTPERRSRIVFVSSGGMYSQKLSLDQLRHGPEPFDGLVAYAQCKRAQVLLARRYAREHRHQPVAFASMHPGWVETKGVAESIPTFERITRPILRTPEQGADTVVWLAASPSANDATGEFYLDREARREHIPLRNTQSSEQDVDALWTLLTELTDPFV